MPFDVVCDPIGWPLGSAWSVRLRQEEMPRGFRLGYNARVSQDGWWRSRTIDVASRALLDLIGRLDGIQTIEAKTNEPFGWGDGRLAWIDTPGMNVIDLGRLRTVSASSTTSGASGPRTPLFAVLSPASSMRSGPSRTGASRSFLYKTYPNVQRIALPPCAGSARPRRRALDRKDDRHPPVGPGLRAPDAALTLDELSRLLYLTGGTTADLQGQPGATGRVRPALARPLARSSNPILVYPIVPPCPRPGARRLPLTPSATTPSNGSARVTSGRLRPTSAVDRPPGIPRRRLMSTRHPSDVKHLVSAELLERCGVVLFLTMIMQRMPTPLSGPQLPVRLARGRSRRRERLSRGRVDGLLGACGVGAFMDDAINDMLGVDGVEEAVVYMLAAGRIRAGAA